MAQRVFVENGKKVIRDDFGNATEDAAPKDKGYYDNIKVPPKPQASSLEPAGESLGAIAKRLADEREKKRKAAEPSTAKDQAKALKSVR